MLISSAADFHGMEKNVMSKKKKYIRHYYLDQLGLKPEDYDLSMYCRDPERSKKDRKKLKKKYKKNGFWTSDTWDLDFTTAAWVYEHLMAYRDAANKIIDMSGMVNIHLIHPRTDVPENELRDAVMNRGKKDSKKIVFTSETQKMSLYDAIGAMADDLARYLTNNDVYNNALLRDIENTTYLRNAMHNYAELLPALWW